MKWTWIIIGVFVFGYFITPPIYRAMKKSEYKKLYDGMQDAKIAGGAYHDENRTFNSYSDRITTGR